MTALSSPRLAMYAIALRRRLALWRSGAFDPYPAPPDGIALSPFERDRAEAEAAPLALSWANDHGPPPEGFGPQDGNAAAAWQARVRAKLIELTGWRRREQAPEVRARESLDGLPSPKRSRFGFAQAGARHGLSHQRVYLGAWPGADVPVDILWRADQHWPAPVMLCLQGTNAGAHLGWGEARMPPDPVKIASGLDFARQATARGYVAVCVEQRCFGVRRERALEPRSADPCLDAVMHGLLFGRTLIGDSASDVSAVIDWLAAGGANLDLDLARLYVLGHSWGGTVAVYAAALDARLGAVIASGCLGPIRETIAVRRTPSGQNVIPGQLNWFELSDVLALCAPRPVLATSGRRDHIFPFAATERVVAAALPAWQALGAGACLRALPLEGGHRFAPEAIWPAFEQLLAGA